MADRRDTETLIAEFGDLFDSAQIYGAADRLRDKWRRLRAALREAPDPDVTFTTTTATLPGHNATAAPSGMPSWMYEMKPGAASAAPDRPQPDLLREFCREHVEELAGVLSASTLERFALKLLGAFCIQPPDADDIAWTNREVAARSHPEAGEARARPQPDPPPMVVSVDDVGDHACQHGTALDVHCCNCHSGFIFDKDHVCPEPAEAHGPRSLGDADRPKE